MLPIRKNRIPQLLHRYKHAEEAVWDGPAVDLGNGSKLTFSQVKDELRKILVTEQHGLCAYCMRSISSSETSTIVEHVQCRDTYPIRQLDYNNMVACCTGESRNQSTTESFLCCDQCKGNQDISFDPADTNHDISRRLRYDGNGRIIADTEELQKQQGENT